MVSHPANSNETYNSDFSEYYDKITAHKDYHAEIDKLVDFLQRRVNLPQPKILDLGCGTGCHAILLSKLGYDVTAIDLSPHMIRIAQRKNTDVSFKAGDIGGLLESDFNFAYSLFNVINCLESIESLAIFLKHVFDRLAKGAVFLVESWNPIAVVAAPPEIVERVYEYEDERIVRKVVPVGDFLRQRLDLTYYIDVFHAGERNEKLKSFVVVHHLLLFTPLEIEYCLRQAGFSDLKMFTALPDLRPATCSDRMLAFVCVK
jgi:SAM-dependent methyltransferase